MSTKYKHIHNLLTLLSKKEKRNFYIVLSGSFLMAIFQVLGVGSIMPFVSVASDPGIIFSNQYLNWAYTKFNFASEKQFLIALGITMLCLILMTNVFMALYQYIKVRYTSMRRHSLSLKLLKIYLCQRYPFFLNRNSYEFIKNINTEVELMVKGSLMQLVEFFAKTIQALLMVVFLLVVNPMATISIIFIVVLVYTSIYLGVRKSLKNLGEERFHLYSESTRIVSEAFWGVKEVKLMGMEPYIIDSYTPPSKRFSRNYALEQTIGVIPKFALEAVAFSVVICYILVATMKSGNFQDAAASVSLYAFAGYRLMPIIQNMFRAYSKIRYSSASSELLFKEYRQEIYNQQSLEPNSEKISFMKDVKLQNINFTYPNTKDPVVKNIDLTIESNSLVGFVGKTGSGKTTLIDIILGLLEADTGKILIDDIPLNNQNIRSWQNILGYVPQNIYLSNDTIEANIAFGIPKEEIDSEAIVKAAQLAQIHTFITSELEDSYKTVIGERGIRLSGGQRQRIGIARALYHNPSVLVMDEATSALDNETEKAVMDAIDELSGKKTILLIAHRITTLKKCNVIHDLRDGKIYKSGTYDEFYDSKN